MNDEQIIEKLATQIMGYYKGECDLWGDDDDLWWMAGEKRPITKIRFWDPLNNPADAKAVQDVMIRGHACTKVYDPANGYWTVSYMPRREGRELPDWQCAVAANDVSELRAAAIAALRAKGVYDE